MTGIIKQITNFFQKSSIVVSPQQRLLFDVLDNIDRCRRTNENCILVLTPTKVIIQQTPYVPADVALIAHEKIGEFQQTLLYIEEQLIKDGHYCIVKLSEDKSHANMFIYIDESILN